MNRLWLFLCRLAYRRLTVDRERIPTGIPTIRDPEARCHGYSPRPRRIFDWDCQGDGHYLCAECAHRIRCSECDEPSAWNDDRLNPLCEAHGIEAWERERAALEASKCA